MWGGGRVPLSKILQLMEVKCCNTRLLVETAADAALGSSPHHQSQGNDRRRETLQ